MALIAEPIDQYIRAHTATFDTDLATLLEELESTAHAETGDNAVMLSGPVVGATLALLTRLLGARRVLEIGTFVGYSALCMASALPDDGELITCDINPKTTAIAHRFWERSAHGKKIRFKLGPAIQTMKQLGLPFDFIFIDADKRQYEAYYERALELLSPGGLIVLDNALRSGRVYEPQSDDDRAVVALNDRIQSDADVENLLLSVRDGLMVVWKAMRRRQ